jgi:ubiquinol-cytochrome c reductase cytochrome b subunit
VTAQTPPHTPLSVRAASRVSKFFSDRLDSAPFLRRSLNKVFPDNWTFLFGEIALYSFVVLVLTGTYLGLFFKPGEVPVIYHGSYVPLRGLEVSQAYDSMLRISFDVRGGLLIRQIHHWAANVFVAAIVLHVCRIFFTAAFRKPREINWLVGVGLLMFSLVEGFAGYSLPDDLLSGTGLRIAYSIAESVPVVGTWLVYLVWGGDFPGTDINSRLFFAHVLLIPGVLIALITAHLGIIWHQKHTDFGGAGKTESRIAGSRFFPEYAAKSGGLFMLVFGALALLGGLAQINPIWLYGPYDPSQVSNASQPDWYVLFLEGSLRLMPSIEFHFAGLSLPFSVFAPAVLLPGVLFVLLALYPFLEQRFTRDRRPHDELDRPRDHPVRTGIGAMALTFYVILALAGADDVIAETFSISVNTIVWVGRFLIILAPPLAYKLTASFCRGLMQDDDDEEIEGIESGIIVRHASGEYVEITAPAPPPEVPKQVPNDPEAAIAETDGQRKGRARKVAGAVVGFFVEDKESTTK